VLKGQSHEKVGEIMNWDVTVVLFWGLTIQKRFLWFWEFCGGSLDRKADRLIKVDIIFQNCPFNS
jgi:hypothetical protein